MAAWVVCALCALVIIKPQEFVDSLAGAPLIHIAFGLAVVAIVLDVLWKRLKPAMAPQVPYALAFLLWALVPTAVKRPDVLEARAVAHATVACVFLAVAVGAGSSRGLRAFAATFVACAALVTGVAIALGVAPYVCVIAAPDDWEGRGELKPDGRPCETVLECRKDAPDPDANYRCERAGPLGTSTLDGRVRYRGSLADPNELSLMAGMSIPLAIALVERRRSRRAASVDEQRRSRRAASVDAQRRSRCAVPGDTASPPRRRSRLPVLVTDELLSRVAAALRAIPATALIAAVGVMVVMSRSRTGLIVYLIVLGASFIRWSGAFGVVAACLVGPPMILFGGRSGAEATESTEERVELLREAFEMIRQTKGLGIGAGQFGDESSIGLTAHNAYLLAAAETGLVGMCLFAIVLYASLKVPLVLWFGDYEVDAMVRRIAPAIVVSLCGALVGIFFLSWAYKDILYMALGASAALYAAARAQDGRVSVRVSFKEVVLVCGAMFAVLVGLNVVLRIRG